MLAAAMAAGMASKGVDVLRVGVMISASHNPMPGNGIKFFSVGGQEAAG